MDSFAAFPESASPTAWLASMGYEVLEATSLAGDVSPRRYFRLLLGDGRSAILAYYPAELRDACDRFVVTTKLLHDTRVRVPAILGASCKEGFMLLEDLGKSTLYDRRDDGWASLSPYFEESIAVWQHIRSLPLESIRDLNPALDRDLLLAELQQTWEIYLTPRQLTGDSSLSRALWQALAEVCEQLSKEPQVVCHRDFMARNLVPLAGAGRLGVLDHQDLRQGPSFYDLASLLNDSLFPPPELESALLARCISNDSEMLSYHRAALQRTVKVVGTFEAFAKRGNPRRLRLIPPTLSKALYHLERVPEGQGLAPSLHELWRPVLAT
jgi:aminoglycoside/choline kinase family phosphotransferase